MCYRAGNSSVELVLILSLTLIVSIAALGSLGLAARDSLARLAAADDGARTPFPNDDAGGQGRPVFLGRLVDAIWQDPLAFWMRAGIVLSVFLNGLLWLLLLRRCRKEARPAANKEGADEADDELANEEAFEIAGDAVFEKRQQILKVLSSNLEPLFDGQLEVRHFMTRDVTTVSPRTTVNEIVDLLGRRRVRHLLVCDDARRLVGVIGNRELRRVGDRASQIMTPNPITVEPRTKVISTITVFLKERISCLPVVQEGKLCGVLTATDLIMALQCMLQLLNKLADKVKPLIREHRATTISALEAVQREDAGQPPAVCKA